MSLCPQLPCLLWANGRHRRRRMRSGLCGKYRAQGSCLEASTLTLEKQPGFGIQRANGNLGTMTGRAVYRMVTCFLLLTAPVMAAERPADLISDFRLKHGEVRVVRDATLDRIALEQ